MITNEDEQSALPVPVDDSGIEPFEGEMAGMEDVEVTDLIMPRLKINGGSTITNPPIPPAFVDNQSNERLPSLDDIIVLGLTKQRSMFPEEMGETPAPPQCRSYDNAVGFPGDSFPWDEAGLSPVENISCDTCPMAQWGKDPVSGKSIPPRCSEQHVYAVLQDGAPAVLTVQRSAMKASRAFMSAFARAKRPFYTRYATIKLSAMKRGNVDYAVPSFTTGGETDPAEWAEYAAQARGIREFLQTPRQNPTEETPAPAPAQAAAAPAAAPAPAPAAAPAEDTNVITVEDSDDLPF